MSKRSVLLLMAVLLVMSSSSSLVHALGGVSLTAYTGSNVTIDGVNSGSEWSDAYHLGFSWTSNNSSLASGGDLWVKNNGTDLLVAVQMTGQTGKTPADYDIYTYNLYLLFDNNNDGIIENYENAHSLTLIFPSLSPTTIQSHQDLHYNSTQGTYVPNTYRNGTAAGSHTNPGGLGMFTWEFAIPTASSNAENLNLPPNGQTGFEIVYMEDHHYQGNFVSSGWAYWEMTYSGGLPSGPAPSANGWAVITRSASTGPPDTTPPTIDTPSIQPSSPGPSDTVTVTVHATDAGSGVKNVSIVYTTNNWVSINQTLQASYNPGTQMAVAQIPPQQSGSHINYYVIAFDFAGNRGFNNNGGSYFGYAISQAPPSSTTPLYLTTWFLEVLAAGFFLFLLGLLLVRKRRRPSALSPGPGAN